MAFFALCRFRNPSVHCSPRNWLSSAVSVRACFARACLVPRGRRRNTRRKLELEKERLKRENDALKTADSQLRDGRGFIRRSSTGSGRTTADEARGLFDDLREGRPVSPEDIFRISKPLVRDLAPLFDRIRVREEKG
jgi:hypothetical protein